MSTSASTPPRLVIYGVGQYGQHIARLAVEKGWIIAAALNREGPKVGQDLGRVIGYGRDLGIVIEDAASANYSRMNADLAVICVSDRLRDNMPAYERLLSAKINVLCHGAQSMFPFGSDPEAAKEIDAMARKNGVTFTGGGAWDLSRVWPGILVTAASTSIKSLYHKSTTNCAAGGLALMRAYGVGLDVATFEQTIGNAPSRNHFPQITTNKHVCPYVASMSLGADKKKVTCEGSCLLDRLGSGSFCSRNDRFRRAWYATYKKAALRAAFLLVEN